MTAFLLTPHSPGAASCWCGAAWGETAGGRGPARTDGQSGISMHVSLRPLNPGASLHQPPAGVSVPSTPMCPTAQGDAHRGGGQAAVQAELVLDGVRELVHHPLAGSSGGVLGRRDPHAGWGRCPEMHGRVWPWGFPRRALPGSGKAKSGPPCSARWLSGGLPGGGRMLPAPRTLATAPARLLGGGGQRQH